MRNSKTVEDGPPPDRFGAAYFVFVMLGVAMLFPWDCFITASDLWDLLYKPFPFGFVLSIAFNWPNTIGMLLGVKFGPRFSFGTRIVGSLTLTFLSLVCVMAVIGAMPGTKSMWPVLASGAVSGFTGSVLISAGFGLAAFFPPRYMGAVMLGQGVAGVAVFALRCITKASLPGDRNGSLTSAMIYFALSDLVIAVTFFLYLWLRRMPITIYYMQLHSASKQQARALKNPEEAPLLADDDLSKVNLRVVFRKVWAPAIQVLLVFFFTLSVYPGVCLLVTPTHNLGDWFPVLLVGVFMVGDVVGRYLPDAWMLPERWTLPVTLLRAVFFPLWIFCVKPRLFTNDIAAFVIMAVFAVSNGYLGTLGMVYGPNRVSGKEKQAAGLIMGFMLQAGIFLGANFALLILYLMTGQTVW